ncbi:MAG: cytochrome P460 family protein [Betaproteobacteria bacterium]
MKRFAYVLAVLFVASCAHTTAPPPAPVAKLKDGEQAVPAGYRAWTSRMINIQRPDTKQVRDIYVNSTGAATKAGGKFANGTVSVMEIYAAETAADGVAIKGADGNMVKGKLLKVYVMGKGAGWGDSAPTGLKNGDWIYSSYMGDGKTVAPDPVVACRGCHLPLGDAKDYFHRYDEYVKKNG